MGTCCCVHACVRQQRQAQIFEWHPYRCSTPCRVVVYVVARVVIVGLVQVDVQSDKIVFDRLRECGEVSIASSEEQPTEIEITPGASFSVHCQLPRPRKWYQLVLPVATAPVASFELVVSEKIAMTRVAGCC